MIFVCVLRTLKIYSVSKFQESNTVLLTIVTMLYIRSAELSLQNWNFLPLTNITIFPIPPCPPPQQPFYSAFPSFSSVQFSRSVVSDSLWPHESQHARPPYPSPTPGVYSNSCPSRQWCHPTISSSVVPFSSCPQSLPASGSFPTSQLFTWGGQSIVVSASASVLPVKLF